jgi:hypothetical protein
VNLAIFVELRKGEFRPAALRHFLAPTRNLGYRMLGDDTLYFQERDGPARLGGGRGGLLPARSGRWKKQGASFLLESAVTH